MADRELIEQKLQTRLGQIKAGLEKLEAESASQQPSSKSPTEETMSSLRTRFVSAEAELATLREASTGAWEDIRSDLQSMLDDMAADIDRIAPGFEEM